MAFTQADLDALDAAYAATKGALSMEFGDQKMVMRSADDYAKLRAAMQRDVTTAASTPRTRYGVVDKGV